MGSLPPKIITPKQIADAIQFLELLNHPFMVQFAKAPDPARLPEFKKLIKKQRRILAKKYHPDLNPQNEDKMKTVNEHCDMLLSLQYQPRQQPNIIIHYSFSFGGGDSVFESTSSSTTYW